MANTIIIYNSQHHGNTKKVVDAVKKECNVDIIDVNEALKSSFDISKYNTVAFASGIYFSKVAEKINIYVDENKSDLKNKNTFAIITCGASGNKGRKLFLNELQTIGMKVLGSYMCNGYDTYGLFGHIGGIKKKHPNTKDCQLAVDFYRNITEQRE